MHTLPLPQTERGLWMQAPRKPPSGPRYRKTVTIQATPKRGAPNWSAGGIDTGSPLQCPDLDPTPLESRRHSPAGQISTSDMPSQDLQPRFYLPYCKTSSAKREGKIPPGNWRGQTVERRAQSGAPLRLMWEAPLPEGGSRREALTGRQRYARPWGRGQPGRRINSATGAPFRPVWLPGGRSSQGQGTDPLPERGVPGRSEVPGRPVSMSTSPPSPRKSPKKRLARTSTIASGSWPVPSTSPTNRGDRGGSRKTAEVRREGVHQPEDSQGYTRPVPRWNLISQAEPRKDESGSPGVAPKGATPMFLSFPVFLGLPTWTSYGFQGSDHIPSEVTQKYRLCLAQPSYGLV